MNKKILWLLFCATVALIRGERLVMHSLTGHEVVRLLREANRLDAIPMNHKVTEGIALLDEQTTVTANDQLGKALSIFGGGSSGSGSYSELCFGTTQRRRIQIARVGRQAASPTAASPAPATPAPATPATPAPVTPSTSSPTPSSPTAPSPTAPSPTSSPAPSPSPAPTPTPMTPTFPPPTPAPTPTTTYTPTNSPTPTVSPTTTPTIPTMPTSPTPPSDGSVNCVSLVKPKK